MRKEAQKIMTNGVTNFKAPAPIRRPLASPEPGVWIATVTPDTAKEWLATQATNNRKLSDFVVARYMADMAAGMWELSEACICFNTRGQLVNGQHRLNAVVNSGHSIQAVVLVGLSETAIRRMDIGRQRNFSQIMAMQGISNTNVRAAIARTIAMLANNTNKSRITAPFLESVYKKNEAAIDVAFDCLRQSGHSRVASAGVIGACAFAYPADRDGVWVFMQGLATGAHLRPDDPVLAFRHYLDGRACPSKSERFAPLALYAVYKALRGERMERFSAPRSQGYMAFFRQYHEDYA